MLLSRNFFSEKHKYHLPHRKKGMFFPTQKKPAPFSLTQAGRKAKHNWSLVSANSASRRAASKRHVFPRARSKPSQPGKRPGGVGGGGGGAAPRGRRYICSLDESYLMGVGSFSGGTWTAALHRHHPHPPNRRARMPKASSSIYALVCRRKGNKVEYERTAEAQGTGWVNTSKEGCLSHRLSPAAPSKQERETFLTTRSSFMVNLSCLLQTFI